MISTAYRVHFMKILRRSAPRKFAISKILDKQFRKIHYYANIKYKRNSRKYCGKNLRRNSFVKRKIVAKKNSIIKIFVKKIVRKKNSRKI